MPETIKHAKCFLAEKTQQHVNGWDWDKFGVTTKRCEVGRA